MPLPKLPTRPAAILDLDEIALEDRPAEGDRHLPQNALQNFETAREAPEDSAEEKNRASSATTLLPALARKPGALLTSSVSNPPRGPNQPNAKPRSPVARQATTEKPAATKSTTATTSTSQGTSKRSTKKSSSISSNGTQKLFVLDTNVLMHDPSSLFRFEEHDVFLPMMTLEELDHHKKGMSEVARNARQVSRSLDALIQDQRLLDQGLPLSTLGHKDATGKLFVQTTAIASSLPSDLPMGKADNQILGVVRSLQEKHPTREVVLVSKDINMRIKARALGLAAEDYFNDQVLEDSDLLYSGMLSLPENFWNKHSKGVESWQQGGTTYYRISGPLCSQFLVNQFVYFEGPMPLYAQVKEVTGKSAVLATLRDYTHGKNSVWGVTARNREQNFAMNLLMNPECDFVTLLGQAGTGKTLLALAAGIAQVLETKRYTEIIMTRVTVPVGEDIGFLPGTEEEKMLPWMGALEDNLDVLNMGDQEHGGASNDWTRSGTMELIRSKIKVKSMNFMRGRTFLNKYLIIDEAQNLTPKQMKTLITRAGPGTKVICLGNLAQIDTPYLTEGSSGLTFVVDRFKGWPHAGTVTLQRGERSRLADYAGEVL